MNLIKTYRCVALNLSNNARPERRCRLALMRSRQRMSSGISFQAIDIT